MSATAVRPWPAPRERAASSPRRVRSEIRSCSQPPTPAIAPRGEPAGLRRGVEVEVERDQGTAVAVEPAQQRCEVGDVGRQVAQASDDEHVGVIAGELFERPRE